MLRWRKDPSVGEWHFFYGIRSLFLLIWTHGFNIRLQCALSQPVTEASPSLSGCIRMWYEQRGGKMTQVLYKLRKNPRYGYSSHFGNSQATEKVILDIFPLDLVLSPGFVVLRGSASSTFLTDAASPDSMLSLHRTICCYMDRYSVYMLYVLLCGGEKVFLHPPHQEQHAIHFRERYKIPFYCKTGTNWFIEQYGCYKNILDLVFQSLSSFLGIANCWLSQLLNQSYH